VADRDGSRCGGVAGRPSGQWARRATARTFRTSRCWPPGRRRRATTRRGTPTADGMERLRLAPLHRRKSQAN
jgi:hypothetical protein